MITFLPKEMKLWVNTPHGRGLVIAAESFQHDNYMWTVIDEKDGKIRHYASIDVNVCPDFTDEINTKNIKPNKKSK